MISIKIFSIEVFSIVRIIIIQTRFFQSKFKEEIRLAFTESKNMNDSNLNMKYYKNKKIKK